MNTADAKQVNELTKAFYERFGQSFGATRTFAWEGWSRVAKELQAKGFTTSGARVRVLDVGAGNGRFERFLRERFPDVTWDFTAVDFCEPEGFAAESSAFSRVLVRDVTEAALAGEVPLPKDLQAEVVVAFGLIHHVPTDAARRALLRALADAMAPGGICVVSFWQFMNDERLAAKAHRDTEARLAYLARVGSAPALEPGDYLLGWQQATPEEGAIRFCHHFSAEEISALTEELSARGAQVADTWHADGHSHGLNCYVALQKGHPEAIMQG